MGDTGGSVDFECVADNLRESFRVIASSRQAGEVRELRGVSIASAGAAFQMFNTAFLSSPVASESELEQRIMAPAVHFQARGLDWSYWVCQDWLSSKPSRRARRVFERLGLRHAVDLPGMIAEPVAPPVKPLPELAMRVDGGSTRDAFCGIGSTCFHVPLPQNASRVLPPSTRRIASSGSGFTGGATGRRSSPANRPRGAAQAVRRPCAPAGWVWTTASPDRPSRTSPAPALEMHRRGHDPLFQLRFRSDRRGEECRVEHLKGSSRRRDAHPSQLADLSRLPAACDHSERLPQVVRHALEVHAPTSITHAENGV